MKAITIEVGNECVGVDRSLSLIIDYHHDVITNVSLALNLF